MGRPSVAIVGGGVLAVTLGVLLRARGYRVRIFAEERADTVELEAASASFASVLAAASVIPHSVRLDGLERVLAVSQRMFGVLRDAASEVVRRQWHYEVFESGAPEAPYLSELDQVERFDPSVCGKCPLQRSSQVPVAGWRFRSFFVEAPQYLKVLFRAFETLGGSVEVRKIRDAEEVASLSSEVLVLCAGMGTPQLLGRIEDRHFEEGQLISLPVGLADLGSEPASYNYTPQADIHPDGMGEAMDVYAYPRRTSLVLGGTRLPGVERSRGGVEVRSYEGPSLEIRDHLEKRHRVPAAMIELNRVLVRQLLGVDIGDLPKTIVRGRRYRGPAPGAGVTEVFESFEGRLVLACYGLGGAGVTLSWGLAARLVARIEEACGNVATSIEDVVEDDVARRIGAHAGKAARSRRTPHEPRFNGPKGA